MLLTCFHIQQQQRQRPLLQTSRVRTVPQRIVQIFGSKELIRCETPLRAYPQHLTSDGTRFVISKETFDDLPKTSCPILVLNRLLKSLLGDEGCRILTRINVSNFVIILTGTARGFLIRSNFINLEDIGCVLRTQHLLFISLLFHTE